MTQPITLTVGLEPWTLTIPDEQRVSVVQTAVTPVTRSIAEMTRDALEHPYGFEAMRRALAPDDRVAIVIDSSLPSVGIMLGEVMIHLRSAGILPAAVTVLTGPDDLQENFAALAREFDDVRFESHDPSKQQSLAYLASTNSGRRLYLNRTLVEADFVILLTGRRYDPLTGYAGAAAALFPAMANEEVRAAVAGEISTAVPGSEPWPVRAEAEETLWLLGMPFLVQAIEGVGDSIQEVVAGLPDCAAEGIRRQDARWRAAVPEKPDTVIAAISGNPGRTSFLDFAKAAATAARVVRKGGRIAVLSGAAPDLRDGARLLRSLEGPTGARKLLESEKPADWAECYLWAFAAKGHSLFLASGYPDDIAEELFATPIHSAAEVQRLIDSGGRVLVIPDAHKAMFEVARC